MVPQRGSGGSGRSGGATPEVPPGGSGLGHDLEHHGGGVCEAVDMQWRVALAPTELGAGDCCVQADVRTPMAARLRASRRSACARLPASQWDGPCSITDAISQYGCWGSPVIAS